MKQWKRYKSYILPYKSAFILGPLMMVTEVLGEILLPKFMSMIINHGVAQKDGGYILKMGLVMAITSFLMAAGGILGAYFAAKASISFTSDLRRGSPKFVFDTSACTSRRIGRVPSIEQAVTAPDASAGRPSSINSDGFGTSASPSSRISNTPISLVEPKRFFTPRRIR